MPMLYILGKEHVGMMSELCSLVEEGKFKAPSCTVHPLTEGNFEVALDNSMAEYIGTKQLLNIQA